MGGLWDAGISGCEEGVFAGVKGAFRERGRGEICIAVGCEQEGRAAPGFDAFGEEGAEESCEGLMFAQEEYENLVEWLRKTMKVKGPPDPFEAVVMAAKAEIGEEEETRIRLRVEAVVPAVSISCTPLTAVPVLSTPLARKVLEWSCREGAQVAADDPTAAGFLTLNQTRKAVLLLEDDPLAYELPLVGVWLRGSALACSSKLWQSMVQDPAFMYTCLRYINNAHIKERVSPQGAEPNTFLALLLGEDGGHPVFIEVTLSLTAQEEDGASCAHFEASVEANVSPLEEKFNPHQETLLCDFHPVENLRARQNFRVAANNIIPVGYDRDKEARDFQDSDLQSASEKVRVVEENMEQSAMTPAAMDEVIEESSHISGTVDSLQNLLVPESDTLHTSLENDDSFDPTPSLAMIDSIAARKQTEDKKTEQAEDNSRIMQSLKAKKRRSNYSELIVAQQEKLEQLQEEMHRLCRLIDDKQPAPIQEQVEQPVQRRNEQATAVYVQGLNAFEDVDEDTSWVGASNEQNALRPIVHATRKDFTECLIPEVAKDIPSPSLRSSSNSPNISKEHSDFSHPSAGQPVTESDDAVSSLVVVEPRLKMTAPASSEDEDGTSFPVDEAISVVIPRIKVRPAQEQKWSPEDPDEDEEEDPTLAQIEQKYLRLAKQR